MYMKQLRIHKLCANCVLKFMFFFKVKDFFFPGKAVKWKSDFLGYTRSLPKLQLSPSEDDL